MSVWVLPEANPKNKKEKEKNKEVAMAIYHLSFKICKRSDGKSSVYLSAYQNRNKIIDNRTGAVWDYSKKDGFDGSIILAPPEAPGWLVADSAALWNEVERTERQKNGQTARYFDVALPVELDNEQKKDLVIKYCQENFVDAGMIADISFHDLDSKNPHAHVMLTMKNVGPEGFLKKNREWNDRSKLEEWRKNWEVSANNSLKLSGSKSRIDSRSLKDQKLDAERKLRKAKTPERVAFYEAKIIEYDREPMKRIHRNEWDSGIDRRKIEQREKQILHELAKKHYFKNRSISVIDTTQTKPTGLDIKTKIKPLYVAIKKSLKLAIDKLTNVIKPQVKNVEPEFKSKYITDRFGNTYLREEYENYDEINNKKIKQQLDNKKSAEIEMRENNKNASNRPKVKKEISPDAVEVENKKSKLKL